MSETNPHSNGNFHEAAYERMFQDGLNIAANEGFTLQTALAAGYGHDNREASSTGRLEVVTNTAVTIASDLQLEPTFFEDSAKTILLIGIAESWLSSEEKKAEIGYDSKLADERAMLVDTAMMIAGEDSGFVKSLATSSPQEARRYMNVGDEGVEPLEQERIDFLESHNDPTLAAAIKALFASEGEDSLLSDQRNNFAVTKTTEEPFEVKVVKLGSIYDLRNAGFLPPIKWPDWNFQEKDKERLLAESKVASDEAARQEELAKPFVDAEKEFEERFGHDMPLAFVRREGSNVPTMYLRAPTAMSILKLAAQHNDFIPQDSDYTVNLFLRDAVATAQHEYAHTQKNLALGANIQLGLILEERKAELVAHDKMGYTDIKYLINDLSAINDASLLTSMENALKQPKALPSLLINMANTIGLRNTLLLMVSKPKPYDGQLGARLRFPHNHSLVREGDASPHDAVLRENLKHKGDKALRQRSAKLAAEMLVDKGAHQLDFVIEQHLPYREAHGIRHTSKAIAQAFTEVKNNKN